MNDAEQLFQTAVQVAHDIRSPLAALGMVEHDLRSLPKDTRELFRRAIARLKDISADLLEEARDGRNCKASAQPLEDLLGSLVAEKRTRYRHKSELDIVLICKAGGARAHVAQSEFLRAISNLFDNAVEACGDMGVVSLTTAVSNGEISVEIRDNGKGMSQKVLRQVGKDRFTFGKKDGNGLGLAYVKRCVDSWGGKLEINSWRGVGTKITLKLKVLASEGRAGRN